MWMSMEKQYYLPRISSFQSIIVCHIYFIVTKKYVGCRNFGAVKNDYALDAFMKFNAALKDERRFLNIYFSLLKSIHSSTNTHLN